MIELENDRLVFRFPEVHPDATMSVEFQRTLRIPDDDGDYPLPPGLGRFPLRHVDDFAERVPRRWLSRGGVVFPMYQSEAMWLNFSSPNGYPFAVKVAAGKVNAVTGEPWREELSRAPQDYVVVPDQPWLDGFAVEKGVIRQFVAMPLGSGYSVEEQLTGEAEHGGIQLLVHPLKREAYVPQRTEMSWVSSMPTLCDAEASYDMGLAPGGRMEQEIYADERSFRDWDLDRSERCFVHIANSLVWHAVTGARPPHPAPTAADYTRKGLPWFEYYGGDRKALEGAARLAGTKSVAELGRKKKDVPLPENESVDPANVVQLRAGLARNEVRVGRF